MKNIRNVFVFLSFSVLSSAAIAADIAGTYKCSGIDPNSKSAYSMNLMVVKTGDTVNFKWEGGGQTYSGTGIFSKSAPDVVATEFWNPKNQNNSGVMVYQVKPDGSLDGVWAYSDKETTGTETCVKQ